MYMVLSFSTNFYLIKFLIVFNINQILEFYASIEDTVKMEELNTFVDL